MSKREKKEPYGREDAPSSRHFILDKLNDIALRVYGPGDRLVRSQEGAPESEQVHEWYREVQEHFYVEKDEHGNEYLYHRDDSGEGTDTGSRRN